VTLRDAIFLLGFDSDAPPQTVPFVAHFAIEPG